MNQTSNQTAAAAPQQQREDHAKDDFGPEAKKNIPTTADVLKQQREEHGVIVPERKASAVARDDDTSVADYLTEFGVGMDGAFFKFDPKDGVFRKTSDGEEIPEGTELVVVYDQIQVGWIKFNGKGNEPDRKMGPLFDGYMPPKRDTLGDDDESQWEIGLNGKPDDPWKHQVLVPLLDPKTDELLIFNTTTKTGRCEANNLIKHCRRAYKKEPDMYPVIRLKVGGYPHSDDRVGWVKTPKFAVVGSAPKDNAAAATSAIDKDLNDEVPF
jgi:hypothetical protein